MPSIIGFDHAQLAMPIGGEPAARAFYAGLLGLTEVPKPPVMAARGGCWFEALGTKLHLGVEADFRAAKKAHPALLVDDLPGLCRALAAAGVEFTPDDPVAGRARGSISDPFGNRIELMQG